LLQPGFTRPDRRLCPIRYLQFADDAGDVVTHRFGADDQPLGDGGVALALRGQSQDFAAWMMDIFDALQIRRAHLAGNSFGGFLALNTAAHAPERVRRIVRLSPAATFAQIWPFYFRVLVPSIIRPGLGIDRTIWWLKHGLPMDKRWEKQFVLASLHGLPINRARSSSAPCE
jgi:pimeloyl-ACP methyl ester carboxylesterase